MKKVTQAIKEQRQRQAVKDMLRETEWLCQRWARTIRPMSQHIHSYDPSSFRFTKCRKCQAGATEQRICLTCRRPFCRKCYPTAIRQLMSQIEREVKQ